MVLELERKAASQRTMVLHPFIKAGKNAKGPVSLRSHEELLAEAVSLTEAIYLQVVEKRLVPLVTIRPSTYLGEGKVEELAEVVSQKKIGLAVINAPLSPGQQKNLEKAWKCKVIDRTALILEIFGDRAQTKEGVMQVELAALEYQKSRLVRSWTHLERQRGGFGFLGGPGETQIELDRRRIADRMAQIKRDLEKVKSMRSLHRKSREEVPYPVVALVGYTNAGKSTLFNRLTGENILAKDMLFATLDPTMRQITLPSKRKIILSDTVGFISDLPTELIAAFRATLEEVTQASLILHVRDISAEDTEAQKQDVLKVLEYLNIESKVIEVWNKADLLPDAKGISALTGKGCDALLLEIDEALANEDKMIKITVPASEGKKIAWLHQHGKEVSIKKRKNMLYFTLRLSEKDKARWEKM